MLSPSAGEAATYKAQKHKRLYKLIEAQSRPGMLFCETLRKGTASAVPKNDRKNNGLSR
jgi:hypothetical protein